MDLIRSEILIIFKYRILLKKPLQKEEYNIKSIENCLYFNWSIGKETC